MLVVTQDNHTMSSDGKRDKSVGQANVEKIVLLTTSGISSEEFYPWVTLMVKVLFVKEYNVSSTLTSRTLSFQSGWSSMVDAIRS